MNQNPAIAAAAKAAATAVVTTAASPSNEMSSAAVAGAKQELQANIAAAIAANPVVQNATNTETHWWQKRSNWSWLAATAAGSAAAFGIVVDYLQNHTFINADGSINWIVIGFAVWSARAAFRAGRATTPLGTPEPRYPMQK